MVAPGGPLGVAPGGPLEAAPLPFGWFVVFFLGCGVCFGLFVFLAPGSVFLSVFFGIFSLLRLGLFASAGASGSRFLLVFLRVRGHAGVLVLVSSLLICFRRAVRSVGLHGNHLLLVHAGFPFISFGVAIMGCLAAQRRVMCRIWVVVSGMWTSGWSCLARLAFISVTRMAPISFPLCSVFGMLLRFLSAFSIGTSVSSCFMRSYGVLVEYMAMSQGRCLDAIRLCLVVDIS